MRDTFGFVLFFFCFFAGFKPNQPIRAGLRDVGLVMGVGAVLGEMGCLPGETALTAAGSLPVHHSYRVSTQLVQAYPTIFFLHRAHAPPEVNPFRSRPIPPCRRLLPGG